MGFKRTPAESPLDPPLARDPAIFGVSDLGIQRLLLSMKLAINESILSFLNGGIYKIHI